VEFMRQAFFNWFPVVVLVAVWLYFMSSIRSTRQRELGELFQRLERVEGLLGRIAVALERGTTR